MTTPTTSRAQPTDSAYRTRYREILDTTFSIDSRALAIVRVVLGALLVVRATVFEWARPRSPSGVIEFLVEYGDIIVIPFALMMLVGYKTRFAVLLAWLTYSLRIRADLFDPEVAVVVGDLMLSLGLFWLMFLPLGRHLSIDARAEPVQPVRILSVASGAFLTQMAVIYFSAGLLKSMNEWIFEATAMRDILASPEFTTDFGMTLLNFPALLAVMSVATVILEVVGAVLVMLPGDSLQTRRLIIAPLFIALHLAIAVTMNLGLFPYIVMVLWLPFLPPAFWDRVWRRSGRPFEQSQLTVDKSRLRNGVAAAAVVIATVSNLITMAYYPNVEGWAADWQVTATHLVLYQQWAMFSVPSSIP